jgi:hypothetical protein
LAGLNMPPDRCPRFDAGELCAPLGPRRVQPRPARGRPQHDVLAPPCVISRLRHDWASGKLVALFHRPGDKCGAQGCVANGWCVRRADRPKGASQSAQPTAVRPTFARIALPPICFGYVALPVMWSWLSLLGEKHGFRCSRRHITNIPAWMCRPSLTDAVMTELARRNAPTTARRSNTASTRAFR